MKTVITYGTFDLFHVGHYNILKRAKEYGDYLIVGVTGDNYDLVRGKLSVKDSLAERIENVRKTGLADKIIVEEYLGQKIDDIIKYNVDTFVIGDDWKGKFDQISNYCELVYLERTKGISSSKIRDEEFKKYKIGIITDEVDDNGIIGEAKDLPEFEIEGVFSENYNIAENFCKKYSVEKQFKSIEDIIEESDILYVAVDLVNRAGIIEKCVQSRKHVIANTPFSINPSIEKYLLELALKNKVVLMENIKMVHIYIFNQLLWMIRSNAIGDIVSFNCSISKNDSMRNNMFYDFASTSLCLMFKIMGREFYDSDLFCLNESGNIEYATMIFKYPNSRAMLKIGDKVRVKNQVEIIGTKGTVRLDGSWWRGNYFEINTAEKNTIERYCTNFDGNGFKYLLKSLSHMIANNRYASKGVFMEESIAITEVLHSIEG